MAIRPKAPLDTIKSQEMNSDLFGLASGENDEIGNSLSFYRQFIGNFFVGGQVVKNNGKNFTVNRTQAVINGVYFDIPLQNFTADNEYTAVDVSATGVINVTSNNSAYPVLEADSERLALIFSDNDNILTITQEGLDPLGNRIRPTGAVDGKNINDKSMPVSKVKDFIVVRDARLNNVPRGWSKRTIVFPKGQKMPTNRFAVQATLNGEWVNGGQGSARFQLGPAWSAGNDRIELWVYHNWDRPLPCGINLICALET